MKERQLQGVKPLLTIEDIPEQGILSHETITFGRPISDVYDIEISKSDPSTSAINKAFKNRS